jgi:AcrR family transcriptional regulator
MYTVSSTASSRSGPLGTHFRRSSILQAAAKVFAKKGAREATVEDVLQEAAIARRTFYRLFKNKEEVLAALYDVSCEILLNAIRQAVASTDDPVEKLERSVDAYLGLQQGAGDLLRVLEAEALRPGSLLAVRREAMLEAASRELAAHRTDLDGRAVDPLVMHGVLVALEGISYRMHAEGPPTKARLDRARRVMLRIVTATLAGPKDAVAPLPLVR